MNTTIHAGQPAGRRFWLTHVEALAESGFSRSEYCRRHHLSYHALTYWVRKQRRLVKPTSLHTLIEVPAGHLLPLRRSEAAFRLHLGSGRMLEIEPDFDQAALRSILSVLEHP